MIDCRQQEWKARIKWQCASWFLLKMSCEFTQSVVSLLNGYENYLTKPAGVTFYRMYRSYVARYIYFFNSDVRIESILSARFAILSKLLIIHRFVTNPR